MWSTYLLDFTIIESVAFQGEALSAGRLCWSLQIRPSPRTTCRLSWTFPPGGTGWRRNGSLTAAVLGVRQATVTESSKYFILFSYFAEYRKELFCLKYSTYFNFSIYVKSNHSYTVKKFSIFFSWKNVFRLVQGLNGDGPWELHQRPEVPTVRSRLVPARPARGASVRGRQIFQNFLSSSTFHVPQVIWWGAR